MSYLPPRQNDAARRSGLWFVSPRVSQSGLTLIEVLITLLVLSIGLVGIAALHLSSIRFAHSSYYTSLASTAALDLEERLWIELGRDTDGCLDAGSAAAVVTGLQTHWGTGTTLTGNPGSRAVVIPGVAIAPGTIVTPAGVNSWTEVPITIRWVDQRFTAAGNEVFAFSARVVCFDPV